MHALTAESRMAGSELTRETTFPYPNSTTHHRPHEAQPFAMQHDEYNPAPPRPHTPLINLASPPVPTMRLSGLDKASRKYCIVSR